MGVTSGHYRTLKMQTTIQHFYLLEFNHKMKRKTDIFNQRHKEAPSSQNQNQGRGSICGSPHATYSS